MDERCPTAALAMALRHKGWRPVEERVDHRSLEIGSYDAAEVVKMKAYHQALYRLQHTLPLASYMPSRQPILYYKLLFGAIAPNRTKERRRTRPCAMVIK
jgi:hypothetical protein